MRFKLFLFFLLGILLFGAPATYAQAPRGDDDPTVKDTDPIPNTPTFDVLEPADPTAPNLSKDEIVKRYVDWFNMFNIFVVLVVGWVSKFILRKTISAEQKAKIGKLTALAIFLPGFVISLVVQATTQGMDIFTAVGVLFGVVTVLGLHTIFLNPIEGLFKKQE